MSSHFPRQLLARYPIISDQVEPRELAVILTECEAALGRTAGDVVEFGCYTGTTSLFLARLLREIAPERQLHVYDSFAGLPEKTSHDASPAGEQFRSGELRASKSEFIKHFRQAGLPLPVIHKAWFDELRADDVPKEIAFAFLDGDYYESVMASLALVWPRLSPGACVVVDDYANEALPGARRAVDGWLQNHKARLQQTASLAVIRPLL